MRGGTRSLTGPTGAMAARTPSLLESPRVHETPSAKDPPAARSAVRIGNYQRGERLDAGTLYDDFAARHASLGHGVLLRHEKWASRGSPEQVAALRHARRFQAELRHPNILPLIDFFALDDEVYSVFPAHPDLRPLTAVLSDAPLWARIGVYLRLCGGLTSALSAIHRRGYIHRTISMRSILVDPEGEPFFSDLGCAMDLRGETGAAIGVASAAREFMTPARAAPEQLADGQILSPGTDIWALGTILYEVRYRRHPFAGRGSGLPELLANIQSMDLVFPPLSAESEAQAEEERLFRPWFARLLDKSPERRYADALEVQRDLETITTQLSRRPPAASAFVAMPFLPAMEPVWRAVQAACAAHNVEPVRVDQALTRESIWDEICEELRRVDFMIAVVSPQFEHAPNPNVMLEVGYMRALAKPVVLVTDDASTLPFDLRTHRAVIYAPGAGGGAALFERLREVVGGLLRRRHGG